MPQLNETEVKTILNIENKKRDLTSAIDSAINELTYVRATERLWWKGIVEKYHLNGKKMHRIGIDGVIYEERRYRGERKIF